MQHFGDITKIGGAIVPPVNVIIGGSPCQDLSIAGRRAGLAGERSGLFMEQIRIIKEMREADAISGRKGRDIRPRYMVWENVVGAFSSNGGEDFKAVLEETIRIAEPDAPDLPLPQRGKWPLADAYYGDGWSVAYRVFDAQFWGVPQRRRRIALVADFGGQTAPEILFEREGVCGYSQESGAAWKRTPAYAGLCAAGDDRTSGRGAGQLIVNDGSSDVARSLTARHDGSPCLDRGENIVAGFNGHKSSSASIQYAQDRAPTIETRMPPDVVCAAGFSMGQSANARGIGYQDECAPTLLGGEGGNQKPHVVCMATQQGGAEIREDDMAPTLTAAAGTSGNNQPVICMDSEKPVFCLQGNGIGRADNAGCNGKGWAENVSYTLNTIDRPAVVFENHGQDTRFVGPVDVSQTVSATFGMGGNNTPFVVEQALGIDRAAFNQGANAQYTPQFDNELSATVVAKGPNAVAYPVAGVDFRNMSETADRTGTLQAKPNGGMSYNLNNVVHYGYIVRRLTPLECERLQGFPDGWTQIGKLIDYVTEYDESGNEYRLAVYEYTDEDGKRHKVTDSSRYKALGNSIAIPPWFYVLQRLSIACGADKTMASLFDGIGGFPLIWSGLHGADACVWASEIEAFPIAVTQAHFAEGGQDAGI